MVPAPPPPPITALILVLKATVSRPILTHKITVPSPVQVGVGIGVGFRGRSNVAIPALISSPILAPGRGEDYDRDTFDSNNTSELL